MGLVDVGLLEWRDGLSARVSALWNGADEMDETKIVPAKGGSRAPLDLEAIKARAEACELYYLTPLAEMCVKEDIPALLTEVDHLRRRAGDAPGCIWRPRFTTDVDYLETTCGVGFELRMVDAATDERFQYCPRCGKPITLEKLR